MPNPGSEREVRRGAAAVLDLNHDDYRADPRVLPERERGWASRSAWLDEMNSRRPLGLTDLEWHTFVERAYQMSSAPAQPLGTGQMRNSVTGRLSSRSQDDNPWLVDYSDVARRRRQSIYSYIRQNTGAPVTAYPERMSKVDAPSRDSIKTQEPALEDTLAGPRAALAVEADDLLGYTPLRQAVHAPGALRRSLATLGIAVLEQASVDAYKAQMVEHYRSHQKMARPTWRIKSLREYKQPVPEHALAKAVEIKRALPQAEFYVDQLAVDPFLIVTMGPLTDHTTNQVSRKLDAETAAYIEVWDEPKFDEKWEG